MKMVTQLPVHLTLYDSICAGLNHPVLQTETTEVGTMLGGV